MAPRRRILRSSTNQEETSRPTTKKKSRSQHLKKERDRQKAIREARKKEPRAYEDFKAKDRERKRKSKENGNLPSRRDMSSRDLRSVLSKMRNYMREYRARKKSEASVDYPVEVPSNEARVSDAYITPMVTACGTTLSQNRRRWERNS